MNETIYKTLVKNKATTSLVTDIAIQISNVYGRNIVMVSATDAAEESAHWATSSVTCGENPKELLLSDDWSECQSDNCPAYVSGEVMDISYGLARMLTPKMDEHEIRRICVHAINYPCTIKIEGKTDKILIYIQDAGTHENRSGAKAKAR